MTEKEDNNIVFVGKKSMRVYAEAVNIQLDEKNSPEVILKTRGKSILTAINVSEFVKRKYSYKVKSIVVGSETFKDEEKDKDIHVSTIEIIMTK